MYFWKYRISEVIKIFNLLVTLGSNRTFFFLAVLGFELRASWLLVSLPLEPLHQPFILLVIFVMGSHELFARTGFEP
jgi:hypothetical protein